ncbi:MAG: hypothetical protein QM346_19750 [Chloroflexota bacterium]|nr:hypothetical protein [Chloroflexota bacterium]
MAQAEQNQPKFVNQIEEAFARILDYYHIRWEYEPRTFDLEWDEMGAVSVAFTPDFYLPDEDLYVELTTLRPKLMRQKNAKLRRMAELYPDVKIKLFKRQDLRDMMIKYGMDEEAEQLLGTEAMTPLPATNGRSDPA